MMIWIQDGYEGPVEGAVTEEQERLMNEGARICLEKEGLEDPEDRLAISLTFVSEDEIRNLNSQFRNVDAVTDVLSFPMMNDVKEIRDGLETARFDEESDEESVDESVDELGDEAAAEPEDEMYVPLGDVVICREKIKAQAEEYGHSETRELIYLFVHSVLHLLGYDHMEDDDRALMRKREDEVMDELGVSR